MRLIDLGNFQFSKVDDSDFEKVSSNRWYVGNSGYVECKKKINGISKKILLHRLILGLSDPIIFVDHIDRDKLNNSKENLRICTNSLNQANRKAWFGKKFKGVYYRKDKKFFVSAITVNGERKHLGTFKNEIDAAKAYNLAAKKFFGKFALLNKLKAHATCEGQREFFLF